MNYDCVIIGGGVIGLSAAYELASDGLSVALIDNREFANEASAAGAGILSAANVDTATDPADRLQAVSRQLHADWHERLKQDSELDNGFWECGGVHLARSIGEASSLAGSRTQWTLEKIQHTELDTQRLGELLPGLFQPDSVKAAVLLPGDAQIDNRAHLECLLVACRNLGVDLFEQVDLVDFELRDEQLISLRTTAGPFSAAEFCVASGAWSEAFLKKLDIQVSTLPVRGQMLAFKLPQRLFDRIVTEGARYLVPRKDGWVIVGSTLEHAGFSKELTPDGLKGLYDFANGLFTELDAASLKKRWAGLRPATFDGFPYIGRCSKISNLIVATGHFRVGLTTSTGTAVIVKDIVKGTDPMFDITPFRISRG